MIRTVEIQQYAAILAFDWADIKHDLCLWDRDSHSMKFDVLEHRPEVLHAFIQKLRDRYRGRPVAVCLEQSKGALAYLLMGYGFFTIYFVHPGTVKKLRDAWTPSGAKDDPADAELVMSIVRDNNHKLRAWRPDTPETRQLQLLCGHRRGLVNQRVKLTNMLRSCLKTYYPLACQVAGEKLNEPLALDFLAKWPSFKALKRARAATLRKFYTAHNCRSERAIAQRLESIAEAGDVTNDPVITESYELQMLCLVEQIRLVQKQIKEYDRQIAKLFGEHAEFDLINSFPATGKVFGPRLLAAFGTDRDRFGSADEMLNLSGIAPITRRSGSRTEVYRRQKCPRFLRQSFHEWALATTKHCLWARAYYVQCREKGKGHHQAVRALAYKWIRIMYKCWQDRVPYDDAHYMSMLKKRGSGLMKLIAEHPDVYRLNGPVRVEF